MAITTFAELKTAIQNWAFRDDPDFGDRAAEFIALAESDLSKRLRVMEMRKTVSLTASGGVFAVPLDLAGIISLGTLNNPRVSLEPISGTYANYTDGSRAAGLPVYYSQDADGIRVYPSNTGTLTLTYWQAIPPLSDASPTNWLLRRSPNAYLYGSLVHAAPFCDAGPDRIAMWGPLAETAIDELITVNTLTMYAGGRTRIAGATP